MRRLLFSILLVFSSLGIFSQITQPARLEIPVDHYDSVRCVSLGEDGLYVIKSRQYKWNMETVWTIHFVDTGLNLKNKVEFRYSDTLRYITHESHRGDPHFLFANLASSRLEVVKFKNPTGERTVYEIYLPFKFSLVDFSITDHAILLSGYEKERPVVLHYSINSKKISVVPGLYFEGTKLFQVAGNNDSTFEVLIQLPSTDSETGLQVRSYSRKGEHKFETRLAPSDKHLISGQVLHLNSGEVLIKGTWSQDRSGYSNGIFIGRIDSSGSPKVEYFNFADFDSFFIYRSDNSQERVKRRIEKNREKGKDVRVSYQMLLNDPFQIDRRTMMLGQFYKPAYDRIIGGEFDQSAGIGFYTFGYRYTHALALIFDENGKLISDFSVELPDITRNELKQVVSASVKGDRVYFLYMFENEIYVKQSNLNQETQGVKAIPIKLQYANDKQTQFSESNSGLERWYKETYFTYGIQEIKNKKRVDVERRRRVFFLNKINLD
jgi:hypothetical protein